MRKWTEPMLTVKSVDLSELGDVSRLSDAELKIGLEKAGYEFKKRYQASENYIHRRILDADVLISVGSNIANFNGYIQLNGSAITLWEQLAQPCTMGQLERVLEEKYGISHGQAVKDVLDFLNELIGHNMVTIL